MPRSIVVEVDTKVIVFDLDDTLYLERDFARSGFAELGKRFADRFDGDAFTQTCCALLDGGSRNNVFDLALQDLGIEAEASLIDQLVAVYRSHRPAISLSGDAERLIGRLDEAMTGLISDGPEQTQSAKVAALGLKGRIDHIYLTGAWPGDYGKPHPRAFETIQKQTGLAGPEHTYIADNAAKDFLAPNRLGWKTVQILRTDRIHDGSPLTPEHAAHSVITSLDEVELAAA